MDIAYAYSKSGMNSTAIDVDSYVHASALHTTVAFAVFVGFFAIWFQRSSATTYKMKTNTTAASKTKTINYKEEVYSRSKVEDEDYDVIVIGSGIGGLTAASLLAQLGKRVLVVEQHYKAGGACHTFEKEGYRFATGIHYVGGMGTSDTDTIKSLKNVLDTITPIDDPVVWDKMKDPMETIYFGDDVNHPIEIPTGEAQIKQYLIERFPDEKDGILEYYDLVKQALVAHERAMMFKSLPLFITKFLVWSGLHKWIDAGYHKLSQITVEEGMNKITQNKELQAVLSYDWGDYGCEPSRASFIMQLLVSAVFADGGYYPRGGPSTIPKKIITQIGTRGGRVLTKAEVRSIKINKHQVIGVQMQDGYVIKCNKVVSDAGFINTCTHLLPPGIVDMSFAKSSNDGDNNSEHLMHSGASAISLFVGLEGNWLGTYNLPKSAHTWIYASHNTSKDVQKLKAMSIEEAIDMDPKDLGPIFVGNPGAKDSSWEKEFPNKTVLEIVCLGPQWKWFEKFVHSYDKSSKSHGLEFESIKSLFAAKIWERVIEVLNDAAGAKLPETLDDVDHVDIATPLTFQHFLKSEDGAIYGLDHDLDRFAPDNFYCRLRPDGLSNVHGLYLSGQDVVADSLVGAMTGGLLCAQKVLGVVDPMSLIRCKDSKQETVDVSQVSLLLP